MQNFSHKSNGQLGDDQNGSAQQDKSRKRSEIQREIIMTEADARKIINEKTTLDAEIRALKKEEDRIRVNMQEKRVRLSKAEYEITQVDATVKALKKKLNLL